MSYKAEITETKGPSTSVATDRVGDELNRLFARQLTLQLPPGMENQRTEVLQVMVASLRHAIYGT